MAKPANLFVPASVTRVTNSTSEVVMGTVTIPAFFLRSPYKLDVEALVECPTTNSTDTFAMKLKLGSTVLAQVAARDVVNDEVLSCRASGTISNKLLHSYGLSGGSAASQAQTALADIAVDTNANVVITVTGQFSVASTSNIADLKHLVVNLQPLD